jgi:hypothetical protein
MYLKLKNVDRTFKVTSPTERMVKGGENNFWVISFNVNEHLATEEVEEYFVPENTSEMVFVTPLPNGTEYEYKVNDYAERVFNAINHSDDGNCVVDFQLSKKAAQGGKEV